MDSAFAALLQKIPLFANLDSESLRMLASRCRRRQYPSNSALFYEGDPGHTLYVILSGRVNIQTVHASGRIVYHAQCGPGEYFGELSLIDGEPRMADAVTADACDLLMLDREAFRRCVKESPQIALNLLETLAKRLRGAGGHVEMLQELKVSGRIAELLLELARTHGVAHPSGGTRIGIRITQGEIADRIGATRESVNRAMIGLKESGAISYDGRKHILVVTDSDLLRERCTK